MGAKKANSVDLRGEWICRGKAGWEVRVPVAGGRQSFNDHQYGDFKKSLIVARRFHEKKVKELRVIQAYTKKHGEKPKNRLNANNNTGVNGVTRQVYPRLEGNPTITFLATYSCRHKGLYKSKSFSTAEYITEKKAFEMAEKQRLQWEKGYGRTR